MAEAPFALLRGAIDAATAASWLAMIDAHPAWMGREIAAGDAFDPYSSSLRLKAVAGLDAATVAASLLHGDGVAFCRARLGRHLACDVDRCWIRRQYAPSRYPPRHAPHSWHQDGALGVDFLVDAASDGDNGLLDMVTCWVALTACGNDAPGLELARDEKAHVLPLDALAEEAVRSTHATGAFVRPTFEAGDALLFAGGLLHRTHVTPAMYRDRTSLEIRLFDARSVPQRLRADAFVSVHRRPLRRDTEGSHR